MKKIVGLVFIALAVVATIPVAILIFSYETISLKIAIFFHLLSVALVSTGIYILTSKKEAHKKSNNLWFYYFLILCLVMPLYGIVLTLFSYTAQALMKKKPPSMLEDDITVQSPDVFLKESGLSKQLELLNRVDIEPFVDILKKGETGLKRSAIKMLGSLKSRYAIKNLIEALQDKDIEISLHAAGILSKLEDDFAIEIKKRTNDLDDNPNDEKIIYALSDVLLSYANSGLLESIARSYYIKETVNVLKKAAPAAQRDALIAKALYELEKLDEALEYINSAIDNGADLTKNYNLKWSILFSKKDYSGMVKDLKNTKESKPGAVNKELTEFWS